MASSKPAFGIDFRVKKMFLRDKRMTSKFVRSQNAALRRFGMIVRRDSRKSIKKGKAKDLVARHLVTKNLLYGAAASSAVGAGTAKMVRKQRGEPPVTWTAKEPNLRTILYGIEKSFLDLFVIIGPVGFSSGGGKTVPEGLEHGDFPFMGPSLERKRKMLLESLLKFGVI